MTQNNNICKASVKCLDVSHYKLNLVAGLIRNLSVKDADLQLLFCKKRGAEQMRKLLLSCAANAENNHGLNLDLLVVDTVYVGKALMLRRFMPRGRGRMSKIEKRYSNVTLILRQVSKSDNVKKNKK